MPNPSEMFRKFTESIEQRNEEYRKLEQSKNPNTRNSDLNRNSDIKKLVDLMVNIKTGYLSKGTKENLLKRIRELESRLGIESSNYNSGEF